MMMNISINMKSFHETVKCTRTAVSQEIFFDNETNE